MENELYKEAMNQYENNINNKYDNFQFMLDMQYKLQQELSKKNPLNPDLKKLNTVGEKFEWLRENKQAFDDEFREIIDALPGMSLPQKERSAVWKRWKAKYNEIRSKNIAELSDKDLLDLKFELCDAFHFFMNMMLILGVDANEMFNLYYIKNAENIHRANSGY